MVTGDTAGCVRPLRLGGLIHGWTDGMRTELRSLEEEILNNVFMTRLRQSDLSLPEYRNGITQFFGLVKPFPDWLRIIIGKIPAGDSTCVAFFRANLRQERHHVDWWRDWASGFGVNSELLQLAAPKLVI
jgi:hypothetical protein